MSCPIRCEHLSKRYRRVFALNDANLQIGAGSIYAVVGPNGAGKTTLIKILMNILRPSSGRAAVLDTDSRNLSQKLTSIGYVSENQELPDWMTISYFLGYLKPFYPTWDDTLAQELVRQFNLPPDRKLGQISRGMKLKAALASSLAYRPAVIILDEPFSGLDVLVRDEFIEGLRKQAAGATILVSSHDLAEIESFASHIAYIENGRIQFSEEMGTLSERFREIEITLEAPPSIPSIWPAQWLAPEASRASVRFVDTRFERGGTLAEVTRLFPQAQNIAIKPMPLRDIFVALARESRKAA
jgi:ABC-2 type transport system ATP-binding protein